jgi:hypothetical protein
VLGLTFICICTYMQYVHMQLLTECL